MSNHHITRHLIHRTILFLILNLLTASSFGYLFYIALLH